MGRIFLCLFFKVLNCEWYTLHPWIRRECNSMLVNILVYLSSTASLSFQLILWTGVLYQTTVNPCTVNAGVKLYVLQRYVWSVPKVFTYIPVNISHDKGCTKCNTDLIINVMILHMFNKRCCEIKKCIPCKPKNHMI